MSSICSTGPHGRATQRQPANALLFACICAIGKTLDHCLSNADGEMFDVRKAQRNAAEGCASRSERPSSCSAICSRGGRLEIPQGRCFGPGKGRGKHHAFEACIAAGGNHPELGPGLDGPSRISVPPQHFYEQSICRYAASPAGSRRCHYGWDRLFHISY